MGEPSRGPRASVPVAVLLLAFAVFGGWMGLTTSAAPVDISVPYVESGVALADLDGDPATGNWTGALTTPIPLENGEAGLYGSADLFVKHDGVRVYFRLDGAIDVPWVSAGGNHFWVGFILSPSGTSHHSGGSWDGTLFGLWDGVDYAPAPTFPPVAVDTNGFEHPPARDATQDVTGRLNYSGAVAPYSFTAEWSRELDTGDLSDISYVADGTTTYNFFVTTDSDGDGSSGGLITHNQITNVNTISFESPFAANLPPSVTVLVPAGGTYWTGGEVREIVWTMSDDLTATADLVAFVNYTGDVGNGTIAGPLVGATSFAWTVPAINGIDVWINVTVVDGHGATDWDLAPIPIVDAVPVDREAPETPQLAVVEHEVAGCINLYWTPSTSPDVEVYRLYEWNESNGPMVLLAEFPNDVFHVEDCSSTNPIRSYWMTAMDGAGNESPPSTLVTGSTTLPSDVVPPLRIPLDSIALFLGIVIILLGVIMVGRRRRGSDE